MAHDFRGLSLCLIGPWGHWAPYLGVQGKPEDEDETHEATLHMTSRKQGEKSVEPSYSLPGHHSNCLSFNQEQIMPSSY